MHAGTSSKQQNLQLPAERSARQDRAELVAKTGRWFKTSISYRWLRLQLKVARRLHDAGPQSQKTIW